MLTLGHQIIQSARTYGQRFFLKFGIHCATHQTRVILISGVVITSLFYPALALYSFSSQGTSFSIFDTTLASIFSKPRVQAYQDLADLWTGYDNFHVCEDAVCLARCGTGRIVRVERVLVQSALSEEDDGALNEQIFTSSFLLESVIESALASKRIPCLKRADGRCLVVSPLAFWNYDKDLLLKDKNVLDTLSTLHNVSVAGVPITPQMVLAGRESTDHHVGDSFDFARFLAFTYFFPETECDGPSGRALWLKSLQIAVGQSAELVIQDEEPKLIALEYASGASGWTAISTFVYLAYAAFFAYVTWCVRAMNAVHSRVGLTFTALVEIVTSTITSLSVCALVGFKVTMVPWELLPIVLMFVGAENMFNLVDAVSRTSVTLPVKQRIAEGLSRAGTSNTLKVVSYNAILGVISVFSAGAIRQFCVFAIVVLVAHWFLAHTFFITVLSIDIQRLELEELLRQNSSLTPANPNGKTESVSAKSGTVWQRARGLLTGRATKNLSLVLLLAITATLYYTTLPSAQSRGANGSARAEPSRAALTRNSNNNSSQSLDASNSAWLIWKTLNPDESTLHIRLEVPSIVTFRPDLKDTKEHSAKTHRPRLSMRTFRSVIWLLKIMILPITATNLLLWGLIVYLLKNSELLDAQRNKPAADELASEEQLETLDGKVSFSTLPRGFEDDVEFIASSVDGKVVVSVGMRNELVIWRDGHFAEIDASDVLHGAASTSSAPSVLTSLAVSEDGKFCAVGTGAGVIAVWALNSDVQAYPLLSLENSSAGVTATQFVSHNPPRLSPPVSRVASPAEPDVLVATYEHGVVAKWAVQELGSCTLVYPTSQHASVVKASLVNASGPNGFPHLLVAFAMDDGSLELRNADDTSPLVPPHFVVQAGNPADVVSCVHACQALVEGENRVIVTVATEAGVISLWDGLTKEFIHTFSDLFGSISKLALAPIRCDSCHFCGHLPPDGFSLTFSVGNNMFFYVATFRDEAQRCSCNFARPTSKVTTWESIGRRSRSNSANNSPLMSRSSRASEVSQFPVSGHGVHSRRASEKESRRDVLSIPLPDEWDVGHVGPNQSTPTTSQPWCRLTISRAGDTTCERGGWGVMSGSIVGVRRRARGLGKPVNGHAAVVNLSSTSGLSTNTLSRWELWLFDPSSLRLRISALSSLFISDDFEKEDKSPRLPFTRVSPFVVSRSRGLAGFGNTLGVFRFLSA